METMETMKLDFIPSNARDMAKAACLKTILRGFAMCQYFTSPSRP